MVLEYCPAIPATGEIHDQVQIDGIYVGSWCCLIAIAGENVIGWQWCDSEKKAARACSASAVPRAAGGNHRRPFRDRRRALCLLVRHCRAALPGPRPAQCAHLPDQPP
jgi:hypothetical protein